jgi:hypothetical protein
MNIGTAQVPGTHVSKTATWGTRTRTRSCCRSFLPERLVVNPVLFWEDEEYFVFSLAIPAFLRPTILW